MRVIHARIIRREFLTHGSVQEHGCLRPAPCQPLTSPQQPQMHYLSNISTVI